MDEEGRPPNVSGTLHVSVGAVVVGTRDREALCFAARALPLNSDQNGYGRSSIELSPHPLNRTDISGRFRTYGLPSPQGDEATRQALRAARFLATGAVGPELPSSLYGRPPSTKGGAAAMY